MDSRRFRRTESPSQCGLARGIHMTNAVLSARDHYAGQTYQDIACAMASPSPTSTLEQSQHDLLDKMLVGDRSAVAVKALVPEGKTARWVMAQQLREQMSKEFGLDYSKRSVPEMIDSLKYNVFPNLFLYP